MLKGKLIVLGTGTSQGVPVIGCHCAVCTSSNPHDARLRSSIHVEWGGKAIQVDCGPDFRQQFLREGLSEVDALLLTHEHQDHIAGMDDLRPIIFRQKRGIRVLATPRVQDRLREQFAYAFATKKYPGAPTFEVEDMPEEIEISEGCKITPIPIHHGSWPVLGFRFNDLVYLTDCNGIDPVNEFKLEGAKTLIVSGLRHESHYSHFSLTEAIEFGKTRGFERIIITHISHELGTEEEISPTLPDGVELGYDGMVLEF